MLPANPEIVKCPGCAHLFWLREAEIVGEEDWFSLPRSRFWDRESEDPSEDDSPNDSQNGPNKSFIELTEDDYLKFLTEDSCKPDQEQYVRVTCWHVANDKYRGRGNTSVSEFSNDQKRNLEALQESLNDSDPNQRLMKAEIARELGLHDEAIDILSSAPWDEPLDGIANKIRDKAELHISNVFVLDGPDQSNG